MIVARVVLMTTAMATTAKRKTAGKAPAKSVAKKAGKKDLVTRRNEYAAKFFPYIEKVARRLARRLPAHVEIDDLISSGVIGLMEAAERFDPKRVDRFEAFAEFRIRGAMLDDLRSRDTLSRDMRRLSNELRDATRRLEAQLVARPTTRRSPSASASASTSSTPASRSSAGPRWWASTTPAPTCSSGPATSRPRIPSRSPRAARC